MFSTPNVRVCVRVCMGVMHFTEGGIWYNLTQMQLYNGDAVSTNQTVCIVVNHTRS